MIQPNISTQSFFWLALAVADKNNIVTDSLDIFPWDTNVVFGGKIAEKAVTRGEYNSQNFTAYNIDFQINDATQPSAVGNIDNLLVF